jgi:predicted RNase H-like HicB family nuclease
MDTISRSQTKCRGRCHEIHRLFEQTATGYSAHVPDLPGCVAAAATLAETTDLIRHAIALHLAGMREDGEPIPEARTIAEYIVAA